MKRAIPVMAAFCLASCGTRTIPVEVRFASQALSDQANAIEVYVIDRCADAPIGTVPASSRSRVSWRRGESAMALSGALPERFGVAAIARNSACEVVAAGCRDATRNDATVVVSANAETGPGCSACSSGICGSAVDASVDAATAADAPIDAANPAESECDCIDQDGDGVIDDGCLAGGNGAVLWQTAFDGPGTQAFRGAALGGDGNVYINGWMTTGSVTNLCGTPYTGGGEFGTSWTIAVNAATGMCANVFERTRSNMDAPSSTFAAPTPGRSGAWVMTQIGAVELMGSTRSNRITLENDPPQPDGAVSFGSGAVRIHPSSANRWLLHFWPSAQSTTVNMMAFNSGGADIVAEVNDGALRWIAASPRGSHAVWVDATRWAVVSPNMMPSTCTMPATPWRLEVHADASMHSSCSQVFDLDLPMATDDVDVVATTTDVWTLGRNTDRSYALIVTRLSDGSSASFPLPRAPDEPVDTLSHLVAAPDGTVFVGVSRGVMGVDDLGVARPYAGAEGYVYHLARDAGGIRQLGMRRFGDNIVGLGMGAGNVVYATAGANIWPMCSTRGTTMLRSDGGAAVVGAIQF